MPLKKARQRKTDLVSDTGAMKRSWLVYCAIAT
jgi:hypothetical protein